ncbi:MAG: hypothetical protein IT307_11795 [Chloroflexi bacterium]|nr:hypothetical protein [Chloroflexota bacterium]
MDELEGLLDAAGLAGAALVEAGFTPGMKDFEIDLADGRTIRFLDCLEVTWHRQAASDEVLVVGGWWLDDPSPHIQAQLPELRHRFHHLVLELGDSLLRVAFQRLDTSEREGPEDANTTNDGADR